MRLYGHKAADRCPDTLPDSCPDGGRRRCGCNGRGPAADALEDLVDDGVPRPLAKMLINQQSFCKNKRCHPIIPTHGTSPIDLQTSPNHDYPNWRGGLQSDAVIHHNEGDGTCGRLQWSLTAPSVRVRSSRTYAVRVCR